MQTIESLQKKRAGLVTYLLMKLDDSDIHGVCDAGMDIREIDAKIEILKETASNVGTA